MAHPPVVPAYAPAARHFLIDTEAVFLNHGSFGATPIAALAHQDRLRQQVERDPIRWFVDDAEPLLEQARRRVAAFVRCDPADMAFVFNATAGVSTVVRALALSADDELLTSSHEYNACSNALRFAGARSGARVVSVALPCPVHDEQEIDRALLAGVTARTRLILLSHITSPSGMTLPVERLTRALLARAHKLGNHACEVLIDSAHGPGYVDLDVSALARAGATYVTGNLHKWCCGPKGSAFLWVHPSRQDLIAPLIISHGLNALRTDKSRFLLQHDFVGSLDYTPWLAVPVALDVLASLAPNGQGWAGVRGHGYALRAQAATILRSAIEALGPSPAGGAPGGRTICPEHMQGHMAAVTLPDFATPQPPPADPLRPFDPLYYKLRERAIQVPVYSLLRTDGTRQRVVRISAAIYNTPEQFRYLADALADEINRERHAALRS